MNQVKQHINKFVPFDISEIFNLGDPIIFGGAVRDSIASLQVHDIDIIALKKTADALHEFLTSKKYKLLMCTSDCWQYEAKCPICRTIYQIEWFNVTTYIPPNAKYGRIAGERNNLIPIQLIKPKLGHFFFSEQGQAKGFPRLKQPEDISKESMIPIKHFILKNVDLSCCGVFIDKHGVAESVKGAKKDCETKSFRILESGEFYHVYATHDRIQKLKDRDWKVYEE